MEIHANDIFIQPIYKHIFMMDMSGKIAYQACLDDNYSVEQTNPDEIEGPKTVTDGPPSDLLEQCYSAISKSPLEFKDRVYVASTQATANDALPCRTNLIARPLDHYDNSSRFQNGIMICATPVFHNNEFRGVLIVDVDWLHIMKLVNDFKFGQYGYAYLQEITGEVRDLPQSAPNYSTSNTLPDGRVISYGQAIESARLGIVIAHPQHNYVGWMDLTTLGIPNTTELSSMQNSLGSGIYKCTYDDVPRWTAYAPVMFSSNRLVNMNNWSVAATLPTYEFIQPATVTGEHIRARIDMAAAKIKTSTESLSAENAIILSTAIVALVSTALAIIISRRIQKDAQLEMEMAAVEATNVKLEHLAAECQNAEALAKSERDKAQSYFDVAGIIMLVLDVDSNIQRLNRRGQEILGFSEHDLIGQDWFVAAVPERVREKSREYFRRIVQNTEPNIEITEGLIISATGHERTILWHARVLYDEKGDINGVLCSGEDITDQRHAEARRKEAEQKALVSGRLASVGEMASGIAHEINNPLTAVIGFSQMLIQREDLQDDIKSDLKIIYDGSERVSNIVTRLLAFARQQKPRRDFVNVNEIIETTLKMRKYYLDNNKIELVTKFDPLLPVTVADGGQLQQVILNLILNAEMAMTSAHGQGTLTISTWTRGNMICISVTDDGPGISPDIIHKIFDPFFTTREVGKGTGLGLSICHGIISEHGGKIYAKSENGRGAEFIVEIPVVAATLVPEDAVKTCEGTAMAVGGTILVVDDELGVRRFLSQFLSQHGYKVETAANADSAYALIQQRDFHLILMDIKMPGVNGIDLAYRIKANRGTLAERIIFMSGDVMEPYIQRFAREENVVIITKPFNTDTLLSRLKTIGPGTGAATPEQSDHISAVLVKEVTCGQIKRQSEKALPSSTFLTLLLILAAYLTSATCEAPAGIITISGSTTVQPISDRLSKIFTADNPRISVVVTGGGSGVGIKDVSDGKVDIGASSRELTNADPHPS